tara:strand:+ start:3531 stop:3983 length:453 start_codon:yes stop_codon:yes gene_type:complete
MKTTESKLEPVSQVLVIAAIEAAFKTINQTVIAAAHEDEWHGEGEPGAVFSTEEVGFMLRQHRTMTVRRSIGREVHVTQDAFEILEPKVSHDWETGEADVDWSQTGTVVLGDPSLAAAELVAAWVRHHARNAASTAIVQNPGDFVCGGGS